MKKYLLLSLLTFLFSSQTAGALTFQEIYQAQTQGQVLGASTTGLVGYWNFDSISNSILSDSSGNGNHGSIAGSPILVDGKVGKALQFNGANDYVTVANNSAFNFGPSDDYSVSVWAKPERSAEFEDLVHKIGSLGGYELRIRYAVPRMTQRYSELRNSTTALPHR